MEDLQVSDRMSNLVWLGLRVEVFYHQVSSTSCYQIGLAPLVLLVYKQLMEAPQSYWFLN